MSKNAYQSINPYIIDAMAQKKNFKKKSESIDLVSRMA
jgi:hypothetical protein